MVRITIRFITKDELSKDFPDYYDLIDYDKSTSYCSLHDAYLPLRKFSKNRARPNGFQNRCKECQNEYYQEWQERQNNPVGVEEKHCGSCNFVKPYTHFSRAKRYQDGLQRYCKECVRKYALAKKQAALDLKNTP